jgi:transcriptional regulator with PAS, ATPase and Fis domain
VAQTKVPDANSWIKEFPAAITICNEDGIIIAMNDAAVETFAADGGGRLIGANVLDCHPEPARSKLRRMLKGHSSNIYTIEKSGKKKLICQKPWFVDGRCRGLVEISFEIPSEMPHFIRVR